MLMQSGEAEGRVQILRADCLIGIPQDHVRHPRGAMESVQLPTLYPSVGTEPRA